MNLSDLKNLRITVMGLGEHGGALGNIIWLHQQEAKLTVTDLKKADQLPAAIKKLKVLPGIKLVLGEHKPEDFTNADLILRNPAVPRNSPFLQLAFQHGVPTVMDSSLFFSLCPSRKIVGVTGSKGKTTTTMAIAQVNEALPIGIEGTSPLQTLDKITTDTMIVFELSSWRLEDLGLAKVSPACAVITSLYPDHLNTYDSFTAYESAKKNIFRFQSDADLVLLNLDDERLREWPQEIPSKLYLYGMSPSPKTDGIDLRENWVTVIQNNRSIRLFPSSVIPFRSEHEIRNTLPAILLAYLNQIPIEQIIKRVKMLKPLPHRLETICETDHITFINDSAATIPDATTAALQALTGRSIIHILGGNNKNLDFSAWAQAEAKANIRHLIWLPGNANAAMKSLLEETKLSASSTDAATMEDAVAAAWQTAQADDVILLSPGATSFGSFKHEFDRGEQFKKAVKDLVKHT